MGLRLPRLQQPVPDGETLRALEAVVQAGLADRRASFELSLAALPRHVGFAVMAGVEPLLHALGTRPPLSALGLSARAAGVDEAIALRLSELSPRLDLDAARDGTAVFAGEPIVRVEGSVFEALALRPSLRELVGRAMAYATHVARLALLAGMDGVVDGASVDAGPDRGLVLAWAAAAGGAVATTNAEACAALGLAFRGARLALAGDEAPDSGGWGSSAADALLDLGEAGVALGAADDEEGLLAELKRSGARGSFVTRSLGAHVLPLASLRYELVAIEEAGSWLAQRGLSGGAPVRPGRKRAQRYAGPTRALVGDRVHLDTERVASAKSMGATTVAPLAHALVRGGQQVEAGDTPALARERGLVDRTVLGPALTRVRHPGAAPVTLSPGVLGDAPPSTTSRR